MALMKGRRTEIPEDAVILSRKEALLYQTNMLEEWKYERDTFAYKHATTVLAACSSLTGLYVNAYYRKKLKLHNYGKVTSYLPIVFIPAIMSALFHREFIVSNVILQDSCPVCIQLRSSALQCAVGCILPAFLAPLSAFGLATQYATVDVPYLTKQPMKVLSMWRTTTQPIGNLLFAIFLGHAILGSAATYFEAKSVHIVNAKMAIMEQDLERHRQHA